MGSAATTARRPALATSRPALERRPWPALRGVGAGFRGVSTKQERDGARAVAGARIIAQNGNVIAQLDRFFDLLVGTHADGAAYHVIAVGTDGQLVATITSEDETHGNAWAALCCCINEAQALEACAKHLPRDPLGIAAD